MAERPREDNAVTMLMTSGFLAIPSILLRSYKRIGLGDEEMMLLLHLIDFRQQGIGLPTQRELAERMMMPEAMIASTMNVLLRQGFLAIEDGVGIGQESYDLRPLYHKLNDLLTPKRPPVNSLQILEKKETGVFELFEQEFGRPLSPLEYEKIVRWLDEDRYQEEIIREALREAVLSAKFNFKYIDRILFEWQKNNIRSLQELTAYREQFRNRLSGPRSGGPANAKGQQNRGREKAPEKIEPEQENKYDAFYRLYGRET
ncbi:DnaD domain-containing protein [Tumebacillus sp. DT12]|uniref:DnaD domain-containing protein n=1 Tax=Tumebacillus lacus TaxID=2995335 RepID=A0ABT3WZ03_9BACL|nr:DnaD domain-containing protein [Tumebacillus lacus]MCX7568732.1 DnaD domain-containing protein [Tumebacillus lacus]